jgi:probable rRNA maturation factor
MRDVTVWNAHPSKRRHRTETIFAVRIVLKGERRKRANVSVVFVDDRYMTRINRMYLRHQGTTDVISFPLGEKGTTEGEVYVNLDSAFRQARDYGVSYACESMRLVIHGMLHLVGYDDRTATGRARMRQREDWYVDRVMKYQARGIGS